MLKIKQLKCEIVEIQDYEDTVGNEHVRVRTFKLGLPEEFEYKAGQFAMLSHDDFKHWTIEGKLKEAAFSICSSPHNKESIEFCIRTHETEGLSKFIGTKLNIGDTLNLRGPFGVFTLREPYTDNVLVSSGTGIAPMISFAREQRDSGREEKIRFFYGFWNSNTLLFKDEIEELKKNDWFEFNGIVSAKEDSNWSGEHGYVQQLLDKYDYSFAGEKSHAYICGNPKMMQAVLDLLPQKGLKAENVHREEW